MPDFHDTSALVTSLKKGDIQAFNAIYDGFADRLFSFVFSRVQVKEVSEGMVQEIFVSLWEKRESLEISASLSAYLFGAAKYKVLSYIRSEKVRKKYAANLALFLAQRFDNSTEELMDLKELQQIIEKSLAALPNKCQIVFRMSRMEHRSIRHIAKDMNISTRTVENYLTQALKHLRTSLGEALALVIWLGG